VATINLPGGLRAWFTGLEVFHPDGRQLQRVGIQPDILVEPTLEGIRQQRDEVLEAAIAALASTSGPPTPDEPADGPTERASSSDGGTGSDV
jgi:C-terminal processing protease CtpA/Prc